MRHGLLLGLLTVALGVGGPVTAQAATPPGCGAPALRTLHVADVRGLRSALSSARAGDRILLADATYKGNFVLRASGTPSWRIQVCGGARAVIDGGSLTRNFGFTLFGSYTDLVGFTVTHSNKGVVVIGAQQATLQRLTVYAVGDEGIHLKRRARYVQVVKNTVHHTGLVHKVLGEGVYVGSAHENWCSETRCQPDTSDDNLVSGNTFWALGAEAVDVKEGTSNGTVRGNTANGTGSGALAWYDINGNGWSVLNNHGSFARRDGFLVDQSVSGWGYGNVFSGNTADVRGSGLGFRARRANTVSCNNHVTNAAEGYADVPCRH
jgi:hypothetical protein